MNSSNFKIIRKYTTSINYKFISASNNLHTYMNSHNIGPAITIFKFSDCIAESCFVFCLNVHAETFHTLHLKYFFFVCLAVNAV